MRDPACELTDGLHLLRLGKLDFEILLLGNVDKMKGKSAPAVETGSRYVSLGLVDPAEKQNNCPFARPGDSNLDRIALGPPVGRGRKLRGDSTALFFVQQADQLPSNQILRCGAE